MDRVESGRGQEGVDLRDGREKTREGQTCEGSKPEVEEVMKNL